MVKLREVCNIYQPVTISKKEMKDEGIYNVFGANGIIGKYDKYNHEDQEVLLGCRGSCGVINISTKKSWINGNSMVISPKSSNLNKKYLYYFLKKIDYKNGIITGTSQPQITRSNLENIEISIPDKRTQEKIIDKLDKINQAIENRNETLSLYDNFINSKFYEMFGDLFINDKNWEVKPFGSLLEYVADIGSNGANSTVSTHLEMKESPDYAIMVRTVNFNANDFEKNIKYISKDTYDFFSKSKVFGGELVMNKIGSPGQIWIMPELNRPVSLGLNLFLMRLSDEVEIIYIYYLLRSNYGENQIKSRIMGAVTKSITKTTVKQIPIYIPPIKLQKQFVELVEKVIKQKELIQQDIKDLESLLEAKMHEYFD